MLLNAHHRSHKSLARRRPAITRKIVASHRLSLRSAPTRDWPPARLFGRSNSPKRETKFLLPTSANMGGGAITIAVVSVATDSNHNYCWSVNDIAIVWFWTFSTFIACLSITCSSRKADSIFPTPCTRFHDQHHRHTTTTTSTSSASAATIATSATPVTTMAVDLDDLIGSMNQVHAGDRGQGIEEMRRNLRATLGSEAMGPPAVVGSSSRQSSLNDRRRKTTTPRGSGGNANGYIAAGYSERDHWQQEQQQQQQYQPPPSAQMQSVNGHYTGSSAHWPSRNAMDSSNGYHPHQHQHSQHYLHSPPSSWQDPNGCNSMGSNGMMACSLGSSGSWNTGASSSSASSSSFGGSSSAGGSSGFNLVLAPANTPQQTPDHHHNGAGGMATSGVAHGHDAAAAAGLPYGGMHEQRFDCTVSNASTPRKLVGGFNPA